MASIRKYAPERLAQIEEESLPNANDFEALQSKVHAWVGHDSSTWTQVENYTGHDEYTSCNSSKKFFEKCEHLHHQFK